MAELSSGAERVCGVCFGQLSKYTCPRCNLAFCSARCYKRHSSECTAEFFQQSLNTSLTNEVSDHCTREHTQALLRRFNENGQAIDDAAARILNDDSNENDEFHESDQEDDDDGESSLGISVKTLERLRLKAESGQSVDVTDLTDRERKDFERAAASGDLSREVETWNPWWLTREGNEIIATSSGQRVVAESGEFASSADGSEDGTGIPPLPAQALPSSRSLVRRQAPSHSVRWHVLETMCTYCMVQRYFNGDWTCDEAHAIAVLLRVSSALAAGLEGAPAKAASTSRSALRGCLERSQQEQLGLKPFSGTAALRDTCALHGCGRGGVLAALEHIRRLFERQASKQTSSECKRKRREAAQVERKLFFMQAYANDMVDSDFRELSEKVAAEIDRLVSPSVP
jgi:hypothetical protein